MKTKEDNVKVKTVAGLISYARNTCASIVGQSIEGSPILEELPKIYKKYQALKMKHQVVDYDDLLEYLLQLLRQNPDVVEAYRERFKYLSRG